MRRRFFHLFRVSELAPECARTGRRESTRDGWIDECLVEGAPVIRGRRRVAPLVAAAAMIAGTTFAAETPLPAPLDVPLGPSAVASPDASVLPAMSGSAVPNAPAIAMISDTTFPDETLVITGSRLAGATLRIWAGAISSR